MSHTKGWLFKCICFVIYVRISKVHSHGRLIEPPSRASMWRYGFKTPPNYNDHELYCGGFTRQYQMNGGKCGICGDAWDASQPRAHEAGGTYGNGIIVRKYKSGAAFTIRVEVTANHRGHFEFRLCPNNAPKKVATQQCLDKYVLRRARVMSKDPTELFHDTWYYPGVENRVYEMRYILPQGLTCSQCVLQWKYIAGNNWGMCANGTGAVGCGPQEEFRACADISVSDSTGTTNDTPYELPTTTATIKQTTTRTPETSTASTIDEKENEIADADESFSFPQQRKSSEYILFMVSILACAFILIIITIGMLYYYYYHYDESKISKWWSENSIRKNACFTAIKNKIQNTCAEEVENSKSVEKSSPPQPPPRLKKNSIGYRGTAENLV